MKYLYWLTIILIFSGCASIDSAILTDEEMVSVVGLAREKVLSEISDLSKEELFYIKPHPPKYSYYKTAGNYADYTFSWDIKDNQRIVVHGRGAIL